MALLFKVTQDTSQEKVKRFLYTDSTAYIYIYIYIYTHTHTYTYIMCK